jgi:hypothetical protein
LPPKPYFSNIIYLTPMKKILKLAGPFLLATLLFTSCKDCDTTVTQVSEDEALWLVYDRNDSVAFVNEAEETIKFYNTALRAEQVPGEGFNTSDKCIEQLDVQAFSTMEDKEQDKAKKYPGLGTYILKRPSKFEVVLLVEGRGEFKLDLAQPTYPSLEVNNTFYTDVYEIVKTDDSKETNVKRLLFNKEFGYLSVEFFNGKKLERM